ncbi:MAG: YcbK family protein [Gammaproteobacteria bacterium]
MLSGKSELVPGADPKRPLSGSKRRFLTAAALGSLGLLLGSRAGRAKAADVRLLSFYHTHTNERLSVVYYSDGKYALEALRRINYLLRDHRTEAIFPIAPRLLDLLFDVSLQTGTQSAFEVICGYRSPATNELLRARGTGVSKNSLHVVGKAIDVRLGHIQTARLRDIALAMRRGGVGYYPKSNFVHLDLGRVRSW